ncbi:Ligand-binding domain of nuclear hormone receptor [Oesophagostomum dentatum]|uniref:Ligand-binding domain of nuclear hormone receptor n=1 Tax=Oesophagostomum dentatum TaxID=61180 RepID=A0A0B1TRK8_OESDE|nr:Ligand-binding domain of nuclear hormone receptor [Oesophagostomum dentatum]
MVADLFLAVEYAKTFQCFANLSEADQQKLLAHAGGLLQIASQAFYTVEQKEDSITFPDGINALQLQLRTRPYQFEKYYRETYSRPVAVIRSLSMTREQFALFKAILLFSPSRSLHIQRKFPSYQAYSILSTDRKAIRFSKTNEDV